MILRVATSLRFTDTYLEICEHWSLEDVYVAHLALDAMEAVTEVVRSV